MNSKRSTRINRQVRILLTSWLKDMLPPKEAEKISTNNFLQFLPEETYYVNNMRLNLNSYHPKWVKKYIKRIIKKFKDIEIENISMDDIEKEANS